MSDLNNLKAKVNLATLVGQSVELKQVGKNLMGRCPFHDDSTASLSVGPKLFNCFGCDAGGDVLKWLQLKEKLDFPAAVARLQELASQFPVSASEPKRIICPENHQDEMRRVAELYHRALLESQPALRARPFAIASWRRLNTALDCCATSLRPPSWPNFYKLPQALLHKLNGVVIAFGSFQKQLLHLYRDGVKVSFRTSTHLYKLLRTSETAWLSHLGLSRGNFYTSTATA